MQLRVEYIYDPESRNWGCRIPRLGIIGGADTREEGEQQGIAGIGYVLGGETEGADATGSELDYLQLTVQR